MFVHTGGERGDFAGKFRQRRGVAFGQLPDASGEGLRDAIQFGLHGSSECGQPFVVHHQRLDFVSSKLAVFLGDLGLQRLRGVFDLLVGVGFLFGEGEVISQQFALVRHIGVALDLGQPGFDAGLGEFAFVGLGVGQQTVLAAVFLVEFLHLPGDGVAVGFELFDGGLFLGKVPGHDERLRDEIGVGFAIGLSLPAVADKHVHIVLHGRGPVVHEVLIHIVGVEQRGFPKGFQQVLGQFLDQRLGFAALGDAFQARGVGFLPFGEQLGHGFIESGELGVAEDGRLDVSGGDFQLAVAGTVGLLEQRGADGGDDLPVGFERVNVAVRDAAVEMGVDVLNVLRFGAVDVAREVEVEVVLRVTDLGERDHAGVAGDFELAGEGVHDPVDVLGAEPVLVAVLDEALGGIDHEDALASMSMFLVQHKDASGDAGAVEQVGR